MSDTPEIRFKGFTDAWVQRRLGEVAEIIGGGTPDTAIKEYWGGDIDWYSPFEIGDQIYFSSSQRKITKLGLQKSSAKILPIGTILFTSRAGIGNTAILAKEGTTNQGFQSIVPFTKELDTYFLYSKTHELKRYGEITGAGSTFVEVSGKQMSNMPIYIPSLFEQTSIGNFFQNLDKIIDLYKRKAECLKKLKKAYLQQMFPQEGESVPKVRFAGFEGYWEIRLLGKHTKLITKGTTPENKSSDGIINFIKVENISDGKILPISKITIEEHEGYLKRSKLEEGDILISIAGTLGRTAIVKKDILPANTNQALAIIRGYNFDPNFLLISLHGNTVADFIRKNPTVGAQPNLSLEQIGNLTIWIPELKEQTAIGNFFYNLEEQITAHQIELDNLKKLKSAYLQKMFV